MQKKKVIIKHIIIILVILCFISLLQIFDINCLIKYCFGIECPACGMTRGMLSLLCGNIQKYFEYNAMALPVLIAVLLEIHFRHIKKFRVPVQIFCIGILIINFIYYIFRIIN